MIARFAIFLTCLFCIIIDGGESKSADYWADEHFSTAKEDGSTVDFNLKSGDHKELDAGLYELATVGGIVWEDEDADGILHQDETIRIAGVPVLLYKTNNETVIDRATTNEQGAWGFYDLDVGEYYVVFDYLALKQPYHPSPAQSDAPFKRRHSIAGEDGRTPAFELDSGMERVDIDMGLYRPILFQDCLVFEDLNGDGLRQENEPAYENVDAELLNENGDVLQSAKTLKDGSYTFENVRPGSYRVRFQLPNGTGYAWSPMHSPAANTSCVDDSGSSPLIALRGTPTPIVAGLYRMASVSAELFDDKNGDGVQDDDDKSKANIPAILLKYNRETGEPEEVARQTTDDKGQAHFDRLPPGDYAVRFDACRRCSFAPQRIATDDDVALVADDVLPTRFPLASRQHVHVKQGVHSPPRVRGVAFLDRLNSGAYIDTPDKCDGVSNVNVRLVDAQTNRPVAHTTTDKCGRYEFTDFPFGDYFVRFERPSGYLFSSRQPDAPANPPRDWPNSAVAPESGISHTFACRSLSEHVINAGLYRAASLTVELFLDADADGILLHDEENIIPNALVRLLKAHDTSFQQQCVTGRDGRCVFDALDPDDYYVKFEPPQTSYHFSQAPPGLHTLRMTVLTDDNDDVRLDAPQVNELKSIVARTLSITENALSVTLVRNAAGQRDFEMLITEPVSKYNVLTLLRGAMPQQRIDSATIETSSIGTGVSCANEKTGETAPVHLLSGTHASLGGGVFMLASVGGYVWHDINANGRWDRSVVEITEGVVVSETVGAGTLVELRRRKDNFVVGQTETDSVGRFDFKELRPDSYYVYFSKCEACKFSPKLVDVEPFV